MAPDTLTVWPWWLEEMLVVLACWLGKTAAECLSTGNSSQIEDFQRNLRVLICCHEYLHL